MKSIFLFFLVIGVSGWMVRGQNVDIGLEAKNLNSGDAVWGPPDPFVKVSYALGSNDFNLVGKTATLHTANPVWTEIFNFQYVEFLDQRLRFEIIENDAFVDDKYGTVDITMEQIYNAAGNSLTRDFGKGTLIIKKTN